jgi:hypothetical protein
MTRAAPSHRGMLRLRPLYELRRSPAAHPDDLVRLHSRRLPLVFATGAGAARARTSSVGTTIVGGMLLSTVLNLILHSRCSTECIPEHVGGLLWPELNGQNR